MKHYGTFYIDGNWVEPAQPGTRDLIDPYTETPYATIASGGGAKEVDLAVAAAKRAFPAFSATTLDERIAMIDRIIAAYEERSEELSQLIAQEVGVPISFKAQFAGPVGHMKVARDLLKTYPFETHIGNTIVRREPIGVCALISPWNWPIQTSVIKIIYAVAAGCTMVLKPSDASPLSGLILGEIFEKAGVPAGVFNVVVGKGSIVGEALSRHRDVDLVSFTGSTAAGIKVGEAAAGTVKRVSLELGGKSANIVLKDADLEKAARWNIGRAFTNTGQSCHAPSRIVVHESQIDEVAAYLVDEANKFVLGDPRDPKTTMGPVVNLQQFESIQRHIQIGLDEGAEIVCGGVGKPEGLETGYFVKPTILKGVKRDATLAQEEIFGPVIVMISYSTEEEALEIANDSIFGLGGYVFSEDRKRGYEFASGIRAGRVCYNGAATNSVSPMGGYKQSGIGRSMGVFGLEEYLEIKSVYGFEEEAMQLPEHIS